MVKSIFFDGKTFKLNAAEGDTMYSVKLPLNWSIEHNGFGSRLLLDSHGNERQLLTRPVEMGRMAPFVVVDTPHS